jgi:carboxypeptidase Taq
VSNSISELRARLADISDLGGAGALLAWDERTDMPPRGGPARAEQLATLSRIRHEMFIADEIGRLLDAAAAETEGLPYDSDDASLVRVTRRDWEKARRVPGELRADMTRAASNGERIWADAREQSDYSLFLPHLERNVELRHRYAACFEGFDGYEREYDVLLDDFEPGMRTAEMAAILSELREGIQELTRAIEGSGVEVDDRCLYRHYALPAQDALAHEVVHGLPLEEGSWRLDPSVHPFQASPSRSDIRITTRYDENYVGTSLWSVMHEAGHGMYENGVDPELARLPTGAPSSLGFHESQSRLWENWVGRGRPYLAHLLPRLRELFPDALGDVELDEVYRAANRVFPSLIRVEADQVTYNLHIALRFDLELEIIEGDLGLNDLPEAWNARTEEYLGLTPPDDANGVLQDTHWGGGLFGYFPTYSLGNIVAGQIWDAVCADIPDLEARIEAGELVPLREWLVERLHRHGGKFTGGELIERVTGGPFSVEPYLRQLRERAAEIYGVAVS